MAYESKVSNKYFGTTFAGTGKVTADTELGQVVDALKSTFSPAAQGFGESYIEKKQSEAGVKMQELYAKHGKDTLKEVMSGKYPELESMYATATKELHLGKFAASDAYLKYKEQKQEYNPDQQDLNSFMSQFVPENIADNGKFFSSGFASTWNSFAATELSADATARADAALKRDMNEHTVIGEAWSKDTNVNFYDHVFGQNGYREKSNTRQNEYARNTVKVMTDKATTLNSITEIENIFYEDRGDGRNMLTSGNEDDSKLWQELQNKKATLIANKYNEKKAQDKQFEMDLFTDYAAVLLGQEDHKFKLGDGKLIYDKTNLQNTKDALIKIAINNNRGDLIDEIGKLESNENTITDNGVIENLRQLAWAGQFDNMTPQQIMAEVSSVNGQVKHVKDILEIIKDRSQSRLNGNPPDPRDDPFWTGYLDIRKNIEMASTFKPLEMLENEQQKLIINQVLNNQDRKKMLEWHKGNPTPQQGSDAYFDWLKGRDIFVEQLEAERDGVLNKRSVIEGLVQLGYAGQGGAVKRLRSIAETQLLNKLDREDILTKANALLLPPKEVVKMTIQKAVQEGAVPALTAADEFTEGDLINLVNEDLFGRLDISPADLEANIAARDAFVSSVTDFIQRDPMDLNPELIERVNTLLTKEEANNNFPQLKSFLDNYYQEINPLLQGAKLSYVIKNITDDQWLSLSTNLGLRPEVLQEITERLYNIDLGE